MIIDLSAVGVKVDYTSNDSFTIETLAGRVVVEGRLDKEAGQWSIYPIYGSVGSREEHWSASLLEAVTKALHVAVKYVMEEVYRELEDIGRIT